MTRNKLELEMKYYEEQDTEKYLVPYLPIIARIDGRRFSKITKNLNKPFDSTFSNIMADVALYLCKEAAPNFAYTQSDEISLVYSNTHEDGNRARIFLSGKISKLCSVLAGMASSRFMYNACSKNDWKPGHSIITSYPNAPLTKVWSDICDEVPHFDCRVFNVPDKETAYRNIAWRQADCMKNSVQMLARHHLGHHVIQNKNADDMKVMLAEAGHTWYDLSDQYRLGTQFYHHTSMRKFNISELNNLPEKHEARLNPNLEVERNDWIQINKNLWSISNKIEVMFNGDKPNVA